MDAISFIQALIALNHISEGEKRQCQIGNQKS